MFFFQKTVSRLLRGPSDLACVCVCVLILCNPMDCSPPGSSVPEIFQARTLEWVAMSFPNACMQAKSLQSCPALTATLQTAAYQAPLSMGFSRQEQWSGLPCPPIMAFTHTSATQGQSCFLIHLAPCIPPAPQQSPRGEATSSGLQFWEPSFTFGGQIFSFHSLSPWS